MAFAAELADELSVRDARRGLPGASGIDARRALNGAFSVVDAGPNTPEGIVQLRARMRDDGALGLVDRSGLALLRPTRHVTGVDEVLRDVDSVRFDEHVRAALPGAIVTFRSDADAVAALVEKGRPTPPCCSGRSPWRRSGPRPSPGCACRRRRRSSPEAADGDGVPQPGRGGRARPSADLPGGRSRSAPRGRRDRSSLAPTSWRCTSPSYSGRSTSRNTLTGVGTRGVSARRESAKRERRVVTVLVVHER